MIEGGLYTNPLPVVQHRGVELRLVVFEHTILRFIHIENYTKPEDNEGVGTK